nr:AraC family transcriptional regulator [Jiella sp. LLJ827]
MPSDEYTTAHATVAAPHSVFSVQAVSPRERFAFWKESIACVFDVEADPDVRGHDFSAELEATLLGDMMLARTTTLGQSWRRSASTIARDGMDHYMIQLFVEGGMETDHRNGSASVGERSLVVFDLSQEVASQTSRFTNLSLIIPRGSLVDALNMPDDQHMRVLPGRNPLVGMLIDHMMSLERVRTSVSVPQAREISAATTSLVAACLNGAMEGRTQGKEGSAAAQIILVKRLIERHLGDSAFSVAQICQMAGISRTKLYSLFEPLGGVTGYVRERRLRRALSALTEPRNQYRPIYEIAAGCGFTNESAFSRAFRQRFGFSPREARQQGNSALATPGGMLDDRRYEHWLHHL